uniref:Uncharacterized protein n=1 Tax=Rhizophagus irregularis (strain DAOM 181602 / DAOM 197198 / MUCL 43194) TaxID=747089 RepID=U9SGM9_RHIID
MLMFTLTDNESLSTCKWDLAPDNLTYWKRFASTTAVQSYHYVVLLGSYDLDGGCLSLTILWDALGPVNAL